MRVSSLAALLLAAVSARAQDTSKLHFTKSVDKIDPMVEAALNGPSRCGDKPAHHYDGKKGFGLRAGDGGKETDAILKLLGAKWHYNWSNHRDEPSDVSFVPMAYDAKPEWRAQNADKIRAARAEAVLGFNEPDINGGTPEDGARDWASIEAAAGKDARLGSPVEGTGKAAGDPRHSWLVDFMSRDPGRVDFVAVHYYRGPDAAEFEKFLTEVHERFCLPIWVTEYGLGDWTSGLANPSDAAEEKRYGEHINPICTDEQLKLKDAKKPHPVCVDLRKARNRDPEAGGPNQFTIDQAAAFLRASMEFMERTPWIERYSWWSPTNESVPPQTSTNLLWYRDASGQVRLTRLGEVYANGP